MVGPENGRHRPPAALDRQSCLPPTCASRPVHRLGENQAGINSAEPEVAPTEPDSEYDPGSAVLDAVGLTTPGRRGADNQR